MSRNQNRKLKYIAVLFWLLCIGNAFDFFFSTAEDLKHIKGKVSEVEFKSYFGKFRSTRRIYYTKTIINVKGYSNDYFVIETTARDSLLLEIQKGDEVELYGRRWYHYLSYIELDANIFLIKKDNITIYDITDKCKRNNKILMIVCGMIGLVFSLMYLDMAKNISLENWFQKRFVRKKEDEWIEIK